MVSFLQNPSSWSTIIAKRRRLRNYDMIWGDWLLPVLITHPILYNNWRIFWNPAFQVTGIPALALCSSLNLYDVKKIKFSPSHSGDSWAFLVLMLTLQLNFSDHVETEIIWRGKHLSFPFGWFSRWNSLLYILLCSHVTKLSVIWVIFIFINMFHFCRFLLIVRMWCEELVRNMHHCVKKAWMGYQRLQEERCAKWGRDNVCGPITSFTRTLTLNTGVSHRLLTEMHTSIVYKST